MEVGEKIMYKNQWGELFTGYEDIHGHPVDRTPQSHPYSYDPYIIWKGDYKGLETTSVVYSDRLAQWDTKKFNECCEKVFKDKRQSFHSRKPADVEKFLTMYFGEKIKLTAIEQGCNVATGYPYWVFYYEEIKEETK